MYNIWIKRCLCPVAISDSKKCNFASRVGNSCCKVNRTRRWSYKNFIHATSWEWIFFKIFFICKDHIISTKFAGQIYTRFTSGMLCYIYMACTTLLGHLHCHKSDRTCTQKKNIIIQMNICCQDKICCNSHWFQDTRFLKRKISDIYNQICRYNRSLCKSHGISFFTFHIIRTVCTEIRSSIQSSIWIWIKCWSFDCHTITYRNILYLCSYFGYNSRKFMAKRLPLSCCIICQNIIMPTETTSFDSDFHLVSVRFS